MTMHDAISAALSPRNCIVSICISWCFIIIIIRVIVNFFVCFYVYVYVYVYVYAVVELLKQTVFSFFDYDGTVADSCVLKPVLPS